MTHVLFGFAAMGGALVALATAKGSRTHRLAGHVFVWPMVVAALTALSFVGDAVGPLAYVMSAATLYLLATSVLAVRHRLSLAPWLEKPLVLVPLVLCAFSVMVLLRSVTRGSWGQIFGPALYAGMFAGLVVGDVRLFLHRPTEPKVWVKRHLLRMLLAFAFAVRALFSIGVDIGLPFEVAVTAPILLALLVAAWWRRRVDGEQPAPVRDAALAGLS